MSITTRASKGGELTWAELDTNFTDLRDGVDIKVPKTKGKGIKVDSLGTPTFGWHDLIGHIEVDYSNPSISPDYTIYKDTIKALRFSVNKECQVVWHLPHDYLMGSPIYIHAHWSHASVKVASGSVTWGFDLLYAKGHDQANFGSVATVAITQNASVTPYRHLIGENIASVSGGSASALDTDILEVDGLIFGRVYLLANNIVTTDASIAPDPFLHAVDIHYQSTGVATKQRAPDFWT